MSQSKSIQAVICPSINRELALDNVVYYSSQTADLDGKFIQHGNYVLMVKKLAINIPSVGNPTSDIRLYISKNNRTRFGVDIDSTVEFTIVDQPQTAALIYISIIDNINSYAESHIITHVKSIIQDTVVNVGALDNQCRIVIVELDCKEQTDYAYIDSTTVIELTKMTTKISIRNDDYLSIGLGGLANFVDILYRLFLSRMMSNSMYSKLKMTHNNRILMSGVSGSGKTLIANNLDKLITTANLHVINCIEYIISEGDIGMRSFIDRVISKPTELHILVLDNVEIIAPNIITKYNSHLKTIVSILKSIKIYDNIVVFAITTNVNSLDPIIRSIFKCNIEFALPSEKQRYEILQVHTNHLLNNGYLAFDVDLMELAKQTDNYTGADLAKMVIKTVENILIGQIHNAKLSNPTITQADFMNTIKTN